MTLSHCWGTRVPLTLTSISLDKFFHEIPFVEMPKTFQDAVMITRRLGVRYLWIDSLCIIQGSTEDWKREAAVMGEIYRYSWCNIAATKAQDSSEGCFDRRDIRLVTPCKVTIDWPGKPQETRLCMADDIWMTQIDHSPLSSRGWVFQEIMLSPRVLHYAKGQVFWECSELRACEGHPGTPDMILDEGKKVNVDTSAMPQHERIFKFIPPSYERYYIWNNAIDQYSRRNLTYPHKDMFIAISGIAKQLIPEKEYLAGLWNAPETLIEQLLWHTRQKSSAKLSPFYRAPSWSWASLDSEGVTHVGYDTNIEEEANYVHSLVKVLDAKVTLEDPKNPYGAITDGYISLMGTIISGTISLRGLSGTSTCYFENRLLIHLNHDLGDLHEGSRAHCLPLRLDTGEKQYEEGAMDILHGLILEPTNQEDGEYYRRGHFSVSDEFDFEDNASNILPFWNMLFLGGSGVHNDHAERIHLVPQDLEAYWNKICLV